MNAVILNFQSGGVAGGMQLAATCRPSVVDTSAGRNDFKTCGGAGQRRPNLAYLGGWLNDAQIAVVDRLRLLNIGPLLTIIRELRRYIILHTLTDNNFIRL